jgi:hypothetical protein
MPFLFPAAFSPTFARTFLASFLSAATSAFFTAAFVRFVNRSPSAPLRFLLAHAAFSVATRDVTRFAFLFSRILLFAPFRHKFLPLIAYN